MTDIHELRAIYTHATCSLPTPCIRYDKERETHEIDSDFVGLAAVRRRLLEMMEKSRIRKPVEEPRAKRQGPSPPFTQIAAYPLGVLWRQITD